MVTCAEAIFRLFAAVGQKSQMSKNSTPDQPNTAAETAPQGEAEIHAISFDQLPPWEARDTSVQLGDVGHVFHTWLKALLSDSSVAPQWISSYQLLLHFQQFTKTIGPTCTRKNWTSWESQPQPAVEYQFSQQATWISHYVRRMGTAFGLDVTPVRRRTAGAAIAVWTRCYKLRVHPDIIQGLEQKLANIWRGSHCLKGWDKLDWLTPLSPHRGTSMPNEKRRNGMTEGFEHCVKSQSSQIHWILKMWASLHHPNYIDPFRIETAMVWGICHVKTYPHA